MPVFPGSRYVGVSATSIPGLDGRVRKFLHPREPLSAANMQEPIVVHTVQAGEVIDEIAYRYSGKPRLWWVIADVSGLLFPLELPAALELSVPIQDLAERKEVF